MHVGKNRQAFGLLPDQRVQVQLPITYTSGEIFDLLVRVACLPFVADRRCMVKVDIKNYGRLSWLWLLRVCEEGRNAGKLLVLVGIIVIEYRRGLLTRLDLGRNIFLHLSDEHNDVRIQPSSTRNQSLSWLVSNYSTLK